MRWLNNRRNKSVVPSCWPPTDPTIPHIEQLEELRSIIPPPPLDISTEKECFDLWMKVMRLDTYRKAVITGLVSSIGSLTESLVCICIY
ncbi:hypothetical protein DAPPUDRAFT_270068 [Daphnia pulex]|uniref:Tubulin-folding cofactor D C-terminal domain-containing protein n=1 Tax=Daphnia pulex TaxID=6669 RepID=E9I048_DAPPU|nr:hypothetical protein DAPPUDRAFT_270068 [Daphnia pulex]|eukprot:EFX62632.1 hypothetical protein DAPPUDRAFT_270068 [Daphnia pulex]